MINKNDKKQADDLLGEDFAGAKSLLEESPEKKINEKDQSEANEPKNVSHCSNCGAELVNNELKCARCTEAPSTESRRTDEEDTRITIDPTTKDYEKIKIYKSGPIVAVSIKGTQYTSEDENVPVEIRNIFERVLKGESVKSIIKEFKGEKDSVEQESFMKMLVTKLFKLLKSLFGNVYLIIIIVLSIILFFQLLSMIKGCS
ncbi:MAG: hypothetical protein ABII27_02710 [bacterium]